MNDTINSPPHYTHGTIEPIDVIEDWGLPFHLANVIKYVSRHLYKGQPVADIRKAKWYLDRYLAKIESEGFDAVADNHTREDRLRCFIHDEAFARVAPCLDELTNAEVE